MGGRSTAKARGRSGANSVNRKSLWKVEEECSDQNCSHLHPDERGDCVAQCSSPACYAGIYKNAPLEPGEVDRPRARQFQGCRVSESKGEPIEQAKPAPPSEEDYEDRYDRHMEDEWHDE